VNEVVVQAYPVVARWVHLVAGVLWVGLLYYFNLVQGPALAAAQKDGSAAGIVRHVVPRALAWFRWAAVVTWLTGAALLGRDLVPALTLQRSHLPIGIGAWLGTIMLINVWVILWPSQKKVLGLVPASEAERERARRRAFLVARVNMALTLPVLYFMAASSHGALFHPR
jgi:uncharacterized membrane protein